MADHNPKNPAAADFIKMDKNSDLKNHGTDESDKRPYKNEEKFFIPVNFFGLLILKEQTMKSIVENNNVKMVIVPQKEDGAKPGLKVLQINGEPKNVEKAATVVENILKDAKIRLQRILSNNSKSFDEGGSEFECPLCCGIFDIIKDGCITCIPFMTEPTSPISAKECHSICVNCIKEYARTSVTGRVAPGGLGLNCVVDKCPNVFLLPSFEKYLDDEIRKPFSERLQEQCVLDTNLKDLVTCPECGYKVCVPPTDAFYVCECGRKQCRSCPKLYDKKHFGKTCKQLADEEARNSSAQKPETKMSELVIRKCHKCGKQFVKSDACNLMESCPCGAKQCYICNMPEPTYAHFCRCNKNVKHGRCPKCGKTCRQWENDKELDDMRLAEFQRQNGTNITVPTLPPPSTSPFHFHWPTPIRDPENPRNIEEIWELAVTHAGEMILNSENPENPNLMDVLSQMQQAILPILRE